MNNSPRWGAGAAAGSKSGDRLVKPSADSPTSTSAQASPRPDSWQTAPAFPYSDESLAYDWQDDAVKGYALWIAINRARLRIVQALVWRAAQ